MAKQYKYNKLMNRWQTWFAKSRLIAKQFT